MQKVYDSAHTLAHAIKDSEEFIKFRELESKVKGDDSLKSIIEDFQKRQLEMQAAQLQGLQPDEEKMAKLQELFSILSKDPTAAEYFQAEMRFNQLMTDVSKILGDVMGF